MTTQEKMDLYLGKHDWLKTRAGRWALRKAMSDVRHGGFYHRHRRHDDRQRPRFLRGRQGRGARTSRHIPLRRAVVRPGGPHALPR